MKDTISTNSTPLNERTEQDIKEARARSDLDTDSLRDFLHGNGILKYIWISHTVS